MAGEVHNRTNLLAMLCRQPKRVRASRLAWALARCASSKPLRRARRGGGGGGGRGGTRDEDGEGGRGSEFSTSESEDRCFRSLVATAGFPSRSWLQGRLEAPKSRQLCRKWALRVSSDKLLAPRGVCLSLAPFTLAVCPSSVRPWRRGDVPDGSNRRGHALMHSKPVPPVDHFGQDHIGQATALYHGVPRHSTEWP